MDASSNDLLRLDARFSQFPRAGAPPPAASSARPPGIAPLGVSLKQQQKYGLSTGPTLFDTLPFKYINKAFILDECAAVGFYSSFNGIKAEVKAYPGAELLVVSDPDSIYGENYFVCLTEEARAIQQAVRRDRGGRGGGKGATLVSCDIKIEQRGSRTKMCVRRVLLHGVSRHGVARSSPHDRR